MTTGLDYLKFSREGKKVDGRNLPKIKLALLSDAATQLLVPLCRALFHRAGFDVKIYEAPFDGIELEVFNPASGLYQFQPDAIVILNATQALRAAWFQQGTPRPEFAAHIEERITRIWGSIGQHTRAVILQSNYVLPHERIFGNFDQKQPHSLYASVAEINSRIIARAREYKNVFVNDVEAVASWIGRRNWFDDRYWDIAKQFCATEHLPAVAENLTRIVLAARGRAVKCVILDLDNTLWGGVVGDDGVDGIHLSAHGDGEGFYRFQSFLLALKNRGILLCVCSKNEYAAAIKPFEEHSEMVLRKDDITLFVANWENKADNIRKIRESLDIGFDSMVFLDDNPFERNLVRSILPDVIVPELPEDPGDYVKALAELNLFETTAFSQEDTARSDLYRAEFERRTSAAAFANFDEYLSSLDMVIDVSRFTPAKLARIAQLLQRSNQFNLTTHRYSESECERMMVDDGCIPLTASLSDRFGDHGLISIVIVRPRLKDCRLEITDWLMSCRVLARGVEEYLMNQVVGIAASAGLRQISAEYIPTAKNAMVKDFFGRFGFRKILENAGGATSWLLDVAAYQPRNVFIRPTDRASVMTAQL
jgi:FkbH-like protein